MVYLLYDLVLLLSSLGLVPYYLIRGVRYGKSRHGIRERLGYLRPEQMASLQGCETIWIHAVSVGETRAAIPLIKGLRRQYPDACLVLSNVTETGRAIARDIPEIDLCVFLPFDLRWAVRRSLRLVDPALILIVETEIWPNFVRIAHERKIPVLLVNGRFSDRSFPRYFRIRRLLKPLLRMISFFCMQTAQDGRRARRIGAPPERVLVTGNLKFDIISSRRALPAPEAVRTELDLPPDVAVWAAGSTHAGEEVMVADVARQLKKKGLEQILIMVPRHPERVRSIGEQLTARGIRWVLRSEIETGGKIRKGGVLLVDTMGEMLKFYSIAELVFVGGSLVPVGGHNLLEASLLSKPVLFGPHMQNFKEIAGLVLESGAGLQVDDSRELEEKVAELLNDKVRRKQMGEHGFDLLSDHAGATHKTLEVIADHWGRKE